MMTRPLFPPAHARAMSVLLSSSSGVGTYGGLKICTPWQCCLPLQDLLMCTYECPPSNQAGSLVREAACLKETLPVHKCDSMRCDMGESQANKLVGALHAGRLTNRSTLCSKPGRNGDSRSPCTRSTQATCRKPLLSYPETSLSLQQSSDQANLARSWEGRAY